jgi:general secretion pathway protein D
VSLGDDLQYGLQWYFTDKARNGLAGTGVFSSVPGGVLGPALAGFSYTLTNSLGQVRAVLNALADKSLVKVISSPSLMVLDNHTAGIAVGNQQPIQSGQTFTTGGNVSTSIQYKDTGVNLQVTPSVSAENVVTMSVNQAVTDVGQIDTATGQRSFLQRQIVSKVAVRSGETLVLGGLIRDNDTTGRSGLPLLSDIPVVGALFGTQSRSAQRTELLVVITPKVVRSDIDAREVGAELRERMKSFVGNSMILRP